MQLKSWLLHLRLNWQVLLLPIFLWGFSISGGPLGREFWLGLFVFHVLFYGGSVAFNSYYDQDQGPIGGLWDPPRPTRGLLIFSLAIQALGMLLVLWWINLPLFILSLVMWALSTAYSHPSTRLKARPWASLLTVSLGQGVGGSAAGWLCGQGDWTSLLSAKAALGILTASLITTGFYPLTQIYQREEDRQRGDITFAVRWGKQSFIFSAACLLAAALSGSTFLWHYVGRWDALVLGGGLLGLTLLVLHWRRHFQEAQVRENYQRMMRLGYLMAGGFTSYIVWRLLHI